MTFDEVLNEMRTTTGSMIGAQAVAGNSKAKQVVDVYKLCYARQEPCAVALLISTYEEWRAENRGGLANARGRQGHV